MTNAQEVQAYLRRHCGSHEAAREFLRLDLGPDLFWPALRKVWSGFDLIPAAAMVEEMGRRSEWWEPCTEWLALPQTFTAYRGQDASRDGICWSRDRAVTVTYTREAALDIAEALLRRASDNLGALTPEADLQMEAAAKAHDYARQLRSRKTRATSTARTLKTWAVASALGSTSLALWPTAAPIPSH